MDFTHNYDTVRIDTNHQHLNTSTLQLRNPFKFPCNAFLLDPLDSPVNHYRYQPLPTAKSPDGGQGLLLSVVLMVFVNLLVI